MNKIYKTMYDSIRGCCVVASEFAKKKAIVVAVASALVAPTMAMAEEHQIMEVNTGKVIEINDSNYKNVDYLVTGSSGTNQRDLRFNFLGDQNTFENSTITMGGSIKFDGQYSELSFTNQGSSDSLVIRNVDVHYDIENSNDIDTFKKLVTIQNFDKVTLDSFFIEQGMAENENTSWTQRGIEIRDVLDLEVNNLTIDLENTSRFYGGSLRAFLKNKRVADHGTVSLKNLGVTKWENLPEGTDDHLSVALEADNDGKFHGDTWTLTDEITFQEGSRDIVFAIDIDNALFIANNNIVDENFIGDLKVYHHMIQVLSSDGGTPLEDDIAFLEEVKKLPAFTWHPDTSKLNANSITLDGSAGSYTGMTSVALTSDDWSEYDKTFIAKNYNAIRLVHNSEKNLFDTHWFGKNTTLVSSSYDFGYNMTDLEKHLLQTRSLAELSQEFQHKILAIEEGGNGEILPSGLRTSGNSNTKDIWLENDNGYFLIYRDTTVWGVDSISQSQTFNNAQTLFDSNKNPIADYLYDSYYKLDDDQKSLSAYLTLTGVKTYLNQLFPILGNQGSAESYLSLRDGFFGEGGLYITTDSDGNGEVYLGGKNTYSGSTVVGAGATLHVESQDAVSGSKILVLEGNAKFDTKEDLNFDQVYFMGGTNAQGQTFTQVGSADGEAGSINVSGVGKHLSFFQSSNSEAGASTLANNDGSMPHHVVNVVNTDINIDQGAALWINHLSDSLRTNTQNSQEMAVLQLGKDASLTISGISQNDSSGSSSHMYIGNGIIQVQDGAVMTLGENSAIHFSNHLPGFFEFGGSPDDPHHHATIEVARGGTVNFDLGRHNHIYADSILAEGHEHYLLATAWGERQNGQQSGYYYNDRNINLSATQEALDHLKETVVSGEYNEQFVTAEKLETVQKFANALKAANIDLTKSQNLSSLKNSLVGQDFSEEEFNEALGTLVTLGMDNAHHQAWQEYAVVSDKDGIYMTVTNTKQWDEVAPNIKLSLKNNANEAIQLTAQSQVGDLAQTSGAYNIVMGAINSFTMGEAADFKPNFLAAARMIDASGQLATVGGAQTIAWDTLQNRRDSVMRHMDKTNLLSHETKLWIDVLGMRNKSVDMWTDLNGERDVKTNLSGIIMGADRQINQDWLVGGAFSYVSGDSKTNLGIADQVNTNNDVKSYSMSVYSNYDLSDHARIKADLGLQRSQNDLKMTFPFVSGITDELTADVDTTAVQLNARYEYDFAVTPNVTVTPFAGVGYTYLATEGYTSNLGGLQAWHTEKAEQHIFSVPVGMKMDAKLTNKNAVIRPQVNVYAQPNFGDTEVENVVRGYGLSSVDHVTPEVIGEWSYGASVGVTFEFTNNLNTSVEYNFHGSNQSRNNSLKASVQYAF